MLVDEARERLRKLKAELAGMPAVTPSVTLGLRATTKVEERST